MGKKTVFTNITPLPPQVSREVAIAMLHNHDEMIELNPLVIEHHPIKTPRDAPKDEFLDCAWQEMTDRIHFLRGGMVKGKVSYKGCFHNLPTGLQTHIYAPMNLDIREKWTICGTLPGEPEEPRELGLDTPRRGLYLREDGEMKCNILMTGFVRKNLDNSHKVLVERILAKAERVQAHLNVSASASPQNSVPCGIPTFQPGSHMGSSSIVRQLAGESRQAGYDEKSMLSRTSIDPAAVSPAQSSLRQDFAQGLAGSIPNNLKPLPRRPSEDEDDAELAVINPSLREQYRQSRTESLARKGTTLPAYHTLRHQKGQFYHDDLAKRPPGKQFAAELEGSSGFQAAEASNAGRPPLPSQGSCQFSELEDHGLSVAPLRSQNAYPGRSTGPESSLRAQEPAESSSHARSQSQPMIEADTYINTASPYNNRTLDRYSVVSGISELSTPKPGQYGFGNSVDNRFSVVSALSEAPTPPLQQQSFAHRQNMF